MAKTKSLYPRKWKLTPFQRGLKWSILETIAGRLVNACKNQKLADANKEGQDVLNLLSQLNKAQAADAIDKGANQPPTNIIKVNFGSAK
jgi:hypothetical protein